MTAQVGAKCYVRIVARFTTRSSGISKEDQMSREQWPESDQADEDPWIDWIDLGAAEG